MCPRVSEASEDWSHWRVHFLPFWNKTGLPQEIHTKMWMVISQQKQQPRRKYQLQVAILCAVFYKSRERDSFFPVEVIYTHFHCHCHWERCSLHNITAAVFGDSPLPKLGNLTSQSEDDRPLCAKPAISQGVK